MTTRIRRTKPQQATDILKALLLTQEAQVAKDQARLEVSLAWAAKTRRALESLQPSLGMLTTTVMADTTTVMPDTTSTPLATGIDDVWSAKDGASTRVHSSLMYERQDRCQLCMEGIPFAAQTRRMHYVIPKDKDGVEPGISRKGSYEPCTGIRE